MKYYLLRVNEIDIAQTQRAIGTNFEYTVDKDYSIEKGSRIIGFINGENIKGFNYLFAAEEANTQNKIKVIKERKKQNIESGSNTEDSEITEESGAAESIANPPENSETIPTSTVSTTKAKEYETKEIPYKCLILSKQLEINNPVNIESFEEDYSSIVSYILGEDLILEVDESFYKKILEMMEQIYFDPTISDENKRSEIIGLGHNRIIFGAPGTGKSNLLEEQREKYFGKDFERVTFHPNYSYAQFVGTYKPVKSKINPEEITYEYIPGPFMRVYVNAIKDSSKNFLLLIEEINRANVASVFGDVFQLLDRKNGYSQYPITASEDQKNYLESEGFCDGEIRIPSNMYIWATMNSADQGVLPMDAAFKRRWDFEYLGIDDNWEKVKDYVIPLNEDGSVKIRWNDFRVKLNDLLTSDTLKVNEDKLLGPFFMSKTSLESALKEPKVFIKNFKSKVLMYLFEDVVKMNPGKLFVGCEKLRYSEICKSFDEKGTKIFGFDCDLVSQE